MTSVDLVKKLCAERKIPIYKIEQDLGFSNGYIRKLQKGNFPADRLVDIARYLNIPLDFLASGGEAKADYSERNAHLTSRVIADKELSGALEQYFELTKAQKEYVIQTIEAMHRMSH